MTTDATDRRGLLNKKDAEIWEELAGKYEFDAGMARAAAEYRAYGDVMAMRYDQRERAVKNYGRRR